MPGLADFGGGILGLGGSLFNVNQQRHAADEFHGEGDLYRSQLRDITQNPNHYFQGPIAQALANASDRRYSSVVGNPAGSGTAQAGALEAMLRGYGSERDRLFHMGGGEAMNAAYPGARTGQMGANMGVFGSLGSLLGSGLGLLQFGGV
jgi:hypothetical protein